MGLSVLDTCLGERPYKFTLENGLNVVFLPVETSSLVALQLWVKTGSIHEDAYLGAGISHFVEHMVFKGTKNRTYADIFDQVQSVGANINAYTSFDRTVFTYDGSADSTELGLDILADMLLNPTFPEEEFVKEQRVVLREIDMCQDDPDDRLSQVVFGQAFRQHPYRYPIIGVKRIFEQLTRGDLQAYWHKRYPVNNMTLVVVGNVSFEWLREKVESIFGAYLPRSLQPVLIPREPFQLAERHERFFGNYQIVRGAFTFKIPGIGHKDGAKLQVLSNVLGSGESSFLYQKLREELQYVYTIDASTWMADGQGLFWLQYTCDPDKRARVEDFLARNLVSMAEKNIAEEHVKKALNQAIVAEIDTQKTISGRAHHMGWADVCLGDLDYSKRYLEQLSQLDVSSVKAVIGKYLKLETCTRVSLEPQNQEPISISKPNIQKVLGSPEVRLMSNGVRLVLQHNPHFPKTHIQVLSLGGGLYEPTHKRGIAQLMASLLTKDTQQHSALEIASQVDIMGAQFNSFTGNYHLGLAFESLPQDTESGCKLLGEALCQPLFREDTFAVEREAQLAAMHEMLDDVFYFGFDKMRHQFFGNHPYRTNAYGLYEDVKNSHLSDLWDYYKSIFSPSNCVLSIVSPLPTDELVKQAEWIYKDLPNTPFQEISDVVAFTPQTDCEIKFDKEQSMVFQAYPSIGLCSEDFYLADFWEELFNGLSSPFVMEVREKRGLAYTVGATRLSGMNQSMLCLYAGTQAPHVETVVDEMFKATQRVLDKKISQAEFESCRCRLKVNHQMRLQSIAKRAFFAGLNTLLKRPEHHWLQYENILNQVTLEEFLDKSQHYLQHSQASTLRIVTQMNDANFRNA